MKDSSAILLKLRELMKKPPGLESSIQAYIIPTNDVHHNEYISPHDKRREFLSNFDGSAGTAVVTNDCALLWTDGRYYQQAKKQIDNNWILMKGGLPTTPTIGKWLAKNLPKGSIVGVDPHLISFREWKPIVKDLSINDCQLSPIETNLIDTIWENQPEPVNKPVIALDFSVVGKTISEKFEDVRKEMIEKNSDLLVISALDEIAWFLNMRGSDIEYNPVFFAYLLISRDDLHLFIDSSKLPLVFEEHQRFNRVKIIVHKYEEITNVLKEFVNQVANRIWISPLSNVLLTFLIPEGKRHQEITPLATMKAVKNNIEAEGMINCHIRDGVALCKYFAWLEEKVKEGVYVDEISGASKLEEFRKVGKHFMGLSFATISAMGSNGSIIHYHPSEETKKQITDDNLYLCDSGAQYIDGTTDVTRTMHFGIPTDFQKEAYTRVLKGQLTLGSAIFPKKIKGNALDVLARKSLWDVGLDYGHGTGHGIGHFLNVHENVSGIGMKPKPDDPGLQANMFLSNEPGYYKDGDFGIRIEDIVQVVETIPTYNFSGQNGLKFKTITLCPKQLKLVKRELLTAYEINALNEYHAYVNETLTPILVAENDLFTLEWLERETKLIEPL